MFSNVSRQLSIAACTLLVMSSTAWSAGTDNISEIFERLYAEVEEEAKSKEAAEASSEEASKWELATFGNGCFWCTEAVFEELYGVDKVISGYSGGHMVNPDYKSVCTGLTGHAEVIHLRFDPQKISYAKLLEVFWRTHDPTTLNRQGADIGTQYRSAVFYHNDEQRELATRFKNELNKAHAFRKPIVTEVTKFKNFYRAENYHQDYFELNGRAPYCRAIIRPKLTKFRRMFKDELEKNPKNKEDSPKE